VDIDTTLVEPDLPDDLDQYLHTSESAFEDIVPGAEKGIIWAGEVGQKTPLSVIYLHGFSATRQETAPLSDEIAAELGANLYYDRFTGHGRSGEALAEATVNDWLNDAYEALEIGRRLGDQVIIIATSTGGSAATWLVAQPEAQDVHSLILISPNFAPVNKASQILTMPWGEQLTNLLVGEHRTWEPSNELHDIYWTNSYPSRALLPMQGLVALAQATNIEELQTPLLLVYSTQDSVVSPAASEAIFQRYGAPAKQLVAIENSDDENNHVIAGDIMSPGTTTEVREHILQFVLNLNDGAE
jgi:esterase/lipase